MSRKKRGSSATALYDTFMNGGGNSYNPVIDREQSIESMYFRVLTELAANRFKWSGLPDSVDVRFLEMTLLNSALSVFYFDKRMGHYLSIQGGGANWSNVMDNPVGFSVTGSNFVGMQVSAIRETERAGVAIPIWANYTRRPDIDIVRMFARTFAQMDRTIEINSENARQSKVLVSSEQQQLTAVNINRQIDEGTNGIRVKGNPADMGMIQVLDFGVNPDTIEKLDIVRVRKWNQCMGLLGIENANQDKKERLVSSEVNANEDQTSNMRFVNLNSRRMAADKINRMYPDLNISVEYHTDSMRPTMPEIGGGV